MNHFTYTSKLCIDLNIMMDCALSLRGWNHLQVVSDFSKIQMTRNVGEDGKVEEEYNFNAEFALGDQVRSGEERVLALILWVIGIR